MYDPGLAARLDEIMAGMLEMEVTRMFGGYGFLMNGHMCVGIWNDRLVIRIGVDGWNSICAQPHVGPMDLTGKVMKGWAMVHPEGLSEDAELRRYVDHVLRHPAAKGRPVRRAYPMSKPHIVAMARTTS
ncbi:MAG: TfoX/Sxy family protein [Pseudomonadota bacterium]|nr:TfoX/Sxy family protein [Pseudomonadota bacterium]